MDTQQSCSAPALSVYLFSRMQQNLLKVQRGVKARNEQLRLSSAALRGSWDASLAPPAQAISPQAPSGCPTAFPFPSKSLSLSRPVLEPGELGLLFPSDPPYRALGTAQLSAASPPSQDFVFLTSFSGSLLHLWFPPFPCLQQLLVPVTALPELCLVPFRMCFPCLPWTGWTRRSHGWTR